MAKYLILNILVLALAYAWARPSIKFSKGHTIALGVLLVMTAVFDSVLVLAQVVGYNTDYTLGVYIWSAPLEDFAYPILAFLLTPVLWSYFGGANADKN